MRIYAFDGDADGLCALVQLRLAAGDDASDRRASHVAEFRRAFEEQFRLSD
jgi:hypothetical protein